MGVLDTFRLDGKVAPMRGDMPAGQVALVVDEIDDSQYRVEAVGVLIWFRNGKGHLKGPNESVRAYEPLCHGWYRYQEGRSYLLSGQSADGS